MNQVFVARVDGSDITHLAAYLDEVGGELRAVCLPSETTQVFELVRASEGERLVWCPQCSAYRAFLAADAIARQPVADVLPLQRHPRGRVKLPKPA